MESLIPSTSLQLSRSELESHLYFATSAINAGGVVIAKFNTKNNPNMDLATSDGHILLGDGHGSFTAMAGTQFPSGNGSIPSIATADFNNDGKADLAITNPDTNVTSIYLGNGDGTFTPGSNYAAIYGAFETGTADLDGDGNPDIVSAMASPNQKRILLFMLQNLAHPQGIELH